MQPAKTPKGDRTRGLILETALGMFLKRGYEKTTMRIIAKSSGVALGNAYYYFPSKESLIQAFYSRTHEDLLKVSRPILQRETDLPGRLRGVLRAKIQTIMPYHAFAGVMFRTAGDPASPLHPFSHESQPVRRETIRLFQEVIDGSRTVIPTAFRADLPELLWLYHLGIVLFWIHDRSPGCRRTYLLIDRSVELIVQLIGVITNPLFRPVRRRIETLLAEIQIGGVES